jgi:hypothetical protein
MKPLAQILSGLALMGTFLPAALFFANQLELAEVKSWMIIAMIIWFVATPFWMEHKATD